MIREDLGGLFLAVISSGRPHKARAMSDMIGPATWVVPAGERFDYAPQVNGTIAADPGGNVAVARNLALGLAGTNDCLLLDDELGPRFTRLDPLPALDMHRRRDSSFREFVYHLRAEHLFALTSPTHLSNLSWLHGRPPVQSHAAIQGGMMLITPGLRFDERLRFHEDLDFTLQHWAEHGGASRLNYLVPQFRRQTPGGVRALPDLYDVRVECAELLVEKWPGLVVQRKTDPGHPMLTRRKS